METHIRLLKARRAQKKYYSNLNTANRKKHSLAGVDPSRLPTLIRWCTTEQTTTHKFCAGCESMLPHSSFYEYVKSRCKKCNNRLTVQRRRDNPARESETRKKETLKRICKTYGVDENWFEKTLVSQNSSCAVCLTKFVGDKREKHIDHCHTTGKVRGLLCSKCNTALGLLKENPQSMLRAIEYLKNHSPSSVINN